MSRYNRVCRPFARYECQRTRGGCGSVFNARESYNHPSFCPECRHKPKVRAARLALDTRAGPVMLSPDEIDPY